MLNFDCDFRLINRELYPLALEVCNYLRVSPVDGEVKILRQWAIRKVYNLGIINILST